MLATENPSTSTTLMDQVITDIRSFCQNNGGEDKGLARLSEGSEISLRTLKRYMNREVMPQRTALRKLYMILTNAADEVELQQRLPDLIYLRAYNRVKKNDQSTYYASIDLNNEFKYNSIFRALYIKSIYGPFYREEAEYRFGEEAREVIKMMLARNVLDIDSEHRLIEGKTRININAESFKVMALEMLQKNFYPIKENVMGEHIFSWHAGSLNLEGYNELLKAEKEFFYKRDKIINNPNYAGEISAWSISLVDTCTNEKLYPEDWEVGL